MHEDRQPGHDGSTVEQPNPIHEAPTLLEPGASPVSDVVPPVLPPGSPSVDPPPAPPAADGGPWFTSPPPPLPRPDPVPHPPTAQGVAPVLVVVVALAAALLSAFVTAALFLALDDDGGSGAARAGSGALDIASLLDRAQPSVVTLQTGQSSGDAVFGGAGSGVIISDDGLVLTNAHVIAGSTQLQVTLSDGRVFDAELVGSSPDDDIALIRLDGAEGLEPAELGSSDGAAVGDEVVAIGNALNLGGPPSVTRGIVSAKDRVIEAPNVTLRGLLQTDAAINPGNSGGPLLDVQGRVIGINTAIISDAQNIGFAIPIDAVRPLIADLEAGRGEITPDTAFLGVVTIAVGQVDAAVLDEYGVRTDAGVFVSDLVPGSAAADGGLELGDVVVAVDGDPMDTPGDLQSTVQAGEPGDRLELDVERGGERRTVVVTLGSRASTGG